MQIFKTETIVCHESNRNFFKLSTVKQIIEKQKLDSYKYPKHKALYRTHLTEQMYVPF